MVTYVWFFIVGPPQPYQDLYVQSARDSENAGEFS